MSQPSNYTPTTDFSQQEAINASGRSTINTAALDSELANIEMTLDATLANLAILQRDDGNLADELVQVPALSRDVLNLIGGFRNRGNWVTATAYAINDIVASSGYLYLCITAHTSAALFSSDSAKWQAFGFGPSDGVAAALAQAAIDAHIADTTAAHTSEAISHSGSTVKAALDTLSAEKASLDSPALTGTPTAPTASVGDSTAMLANTAFVQAAIAAIATGGETLTSLGAIFNTSVSKTSAYTVVAGDKGKLFEVSGTWTLSLTAAATLGNGFAFAVSNTGAGTITIDPASTETIDAVSTIALAAGKSLIVYCDGAQLMTFGRGGVESLNGVSGAVTTTGLYDIGSPIMARPANASDYAPNTTIAGSSLYSSGGAVQWNGGSWYIGGVTVSADLVSVGTWRCTSRAAGTGTAGSMGEWIRVS